MFSPHQLFLRHGSHLVAKLHAHLEAVNHGLLSQLLRTDMSAQPFSWAEERPPMDEHRSGYCISSDRNGACHGLQRRYSHVGA